MIFLLKWGNLEGPLDFQMVSMKKRWPVALALMLLLTPVVWARRVSGHEAELAARKWIEIENSSPQFRLTKAVFRLSQLKPLAYKKSPIGFVAQLSPQGFMIIPDITELAPIRFIAFEGAFEKLKEHTLLQAVFEQALLAKIRLGYLSDQSGIFTFGMTDPIDYIQQYANEKLWHGLLSGTQTPLSTLAEEAVTPLMTSRWDQGNPYNLYTPTVETRHAPTGCSATAQAQIMYYWKYPAWGQGSHAYPWKDTTLGADFMHEYYWGRMVDMCTPFSSPSAKDAVARLMSDVGISMDMDYESDGSAAVPNANNGLVAFFKYSRDAEFVSRPDYPNWTAWFHVFKEQMDKHRPACLAIFSSTTGHSVVIDGYRTSGGNQVHVNMGWGGFSDNYYTLDNILDFTDISQYAVINIHPGHEEMPVIVTHPQSQTVAYGQGVTLFVVATGAPSLSYQWYQGESGDTSHPLPGAVQRYCSFYSLADGLLYWVRVSNDFGYADSHPATIYLPVYPPANFGLVRSENDFIFFKEYINRLSWQSNPENRTVISRYRLYKKKKGEGDFNYRVIKEFGPDVFSCEERGLLVLELYSYKMTSVNIHEKESDPVWVSN